MADESNSLLPISYSLYPIIGEKSDVFCVFGVVVVDEVILRVVDVVIHDIFDDTLGMSGLDVVVASLGICDISISGIADNFFISRFSFKLTPSLSTSELASLLTFFDDDSIWEFSLEKRDSEKDDEDGGEVDLRHTIDVSDEDDGEDDGEDGDDGDEDGEDDGEDDGDDDDDADDSEVESQSDATTKESFVEEFIGVDFCTEILEEQIARDSLSETVDEQLESVSLWRARDSIKELCRVISRASLFASLSSQASMS